MNKTGTSKNTLHIASFASPSPIQTNSPMNKKSTKIGEIVVQAFERVAENKRDNPYHMRRKMLINSIQSNQSNSTNVASSH